MPKNTKSREAGEDIKIPPVGTGAFSSSRDGDLANLQDKLFGGPAGDEGNNKPNHDADDKNQTNGTGPDRAADLFNKTQEVTNTLKDDNKKKPSKKKVDEKTGEADFDGAFPEFDASQFLKDDNAPSETEEPTEEPEPGEDNDVDLDKEENLKNLRQIAGGFKQERDELKEKISELESQLTNRPDSTHYEQENARLKTRIEELEKYELVFGLQNNPAFKERFINPANQVMDEMKQIVTDYGLEEDIVSDILVIDNRKDLDEVLEETFASASARTDIKALKQKYDGIEKERQEFEKKPREALTQFQSEQAQSESEINHKRDTHLKTVTNNGWAAALSVAAQASKESKIYELIEQPGKKDHNEKVVRPTLNNAKQMLDTGMGYIESLVRQKAVPSAGFVQWLAQICQQAAATQMVNHVRWGIYDKYNELSQQQNKQNGYDRPGINPQGRGVPGGSSSKPKTGKEAAAAIFESVIAEN